MAEYEQGWEVTDDWLPVLVPNMKGLPIRKSWIKDGKTHTNETEVTVNFKKFVIPIGVATKVPPAVHEVLTKHIASLTPLNRVK
jgi:hypothetical protein